MDTHTDKKKEKLQNKMKARITLYIVPSSFISLLHQVEV